MKRADQASLLVIGCGNTLRGDDGVGVVVAEAVDRWNLSGVEALAVHQLTPELANDVVKVKEVIFVDASLDNRQLTVESLPGQGVTESIGVGVHRVAPGEILALAREVYGHAPLAWTLGVPVFTFDRPDTITPLTRRFMQDAFRWIRIRIQHQSGRFTPCMN